ncbi:NfeD family protein [Paenibacillus spiritus]
MEERNVTFQKRWPAVCLMLVCLLMLLALPSVSAASGSGEARPSVKTDVAGQGPVYVIPVDQRIERGLQAFLERGFKEARKYEASLIVLTIDTPGGLVASAEEIGALIRDSRIPVLAYIEGDAASAGSYLALNADAIVMKPGSMMGSASLVDGSGRAIEDAKLISFWKAKMTGAALLNRRDPDIAAGMTDRNLVFDKPEIGLKKEKGEITALSPEQALKAGYADAIEPTVKEAADWMGYGGHDMIQVKHTGAEKLSTFLTNPIVMTILLFLGIAGVVIELLVPGFGVFGIVGIVAFVLYFFGNYVAGFAGAETWLLFIAGLVMLVLEVFVPSFGILGLLGSACLIAGVVRAAFSLEHALFSLGIAFGAAVVVIAIVVMVFRDRGIWNRFILSSSLTREEGFVPVAPLPELLGERGVSLTPLRPAGTAEIGGRRFDVITEGGFIAASVPVRVIRVEGGKVVVQTIQVEG